MKSDGRDRRERFVRLMKEHEGMVFRFCLRRLHDRPLAEDVLQRVFIEAYDGLDRYEHRSKLSTWLLGIARHRCQDANKSKDRRSRREAQDEELVETAIDLSRDPAVMIDRARLDEMLAECMSRLQAESRDAVRERFQLGLSYEEMATKRGVKADTLRARVTRALPLLRTCLEEKGWNGA